MSRYLVLILFFGVVFGGVVRPLKVFNTTGPTVATLALARNWNERSAPCVADGDAIVFTSAANGLIHPGRPVPDGGIYVIPRAALKLFNQADQLEYQLVTGDLPWTNQIQFLEPDSEGLDLPFPALVGVNGRFPSAPRFVFPSVKGSVFIIDTTTLPGQVHIISDQSGECEWYYQEYVLYDINQDGRLDILTVRVRDDVCAPLKVFPPFPLKAEFVAFIQPINPLIFPWPMELLYNFDNVTNRAALGFFEFIDIDKPVYGRSDHPTPELLYSEFYGQSSAIYHVNTDWLATDKIVNRTVIEDSLGEMYSIRLVDVNADGKSDIVATTHTVRPDNGIYAYDITGDFRVEERLTSTRYPLAVDFPVIGRPASAQRYRTGDFSILEQSGKRKPVIFLGTDGGGQLLLLKPDNNNKNSWDYTGTVLVEFGCDILSVLIYDINRDGKKEISAPCLSGDSIFSFSTNYK